MIILSKTFPKTLFQDSRKETSPKNDVTSFRYVTGGLPNSFTDLLSNEHSVNHEGWLQSSRKQIGHRHRTSELSTYLSLVAALQSENTIFL